MKQCVLGRFAHREWCVDDHTGGPAVLHDPPRPDEHCPTATQGQLLTGFDEKESVTTWTSDYLQRTPQAASIHWSDQERFSCTGALHVHALFDASNTASFAVRKMPQSELLDWSKYKRLHASVRLGAPGVGATEGILQVSLLVATDEENLASGTVRYSSIDAAWLRDFSWHSVFMDLEPTNLSRVSAFGIVLRAQEGAIVPPEVDLYLDDIWLE